MSKTSALNYKDAGVDVEAGNTLVDLIKPLAARTQGPEVLAGLGGFAGLFELPQGQYKHPVLVSATDGVGTKLKLAQQLDHHTGIGIDLVAMCVNDILAQGATPLFFLDYFATGHLKPLKAKTVIESIAQGCEQAHMALIGGETAEMPGMYSGDDYDLAGFCVGIVEKEKIITPQNVRAGDTLIGIASSGPHANGYSLIRKIIDHNNADLHQPFDGSTLGHTLLTPTRIYVNALKKTMATTPIHGIAHITGGGFQENIVRILNPGLTAEIDTRSWAWPAIFSWLQEHGTISTEDMYRTFNCGVGMVLSVHSDDARNVIETLHAHNESAWVIGQVTGNNTAAKTVLFKEATA